jgi:hypothetical protein
MSYTEDLEKSLAEVFRKSEEEGNGEGLFSAIGDLLINETRHSFRRGIELSAESEREGDQAKPGRLKDIAPRSMRERGLSFWSARREVGGGGRSNPTTTVGCEMECLGIKKTPLRGFWQA